MEDNELKVVDDTEADGCMPQGEKRGSAVGKDKIILALAFIALLSCAVAVVSCYRADAAYKRADLAYETVKVLQDKTNKGNADSFATISSDIAVLQIKNDDLDKRVSDVESLGEQMDRLISSLVSKQNSLSTSFYNHLLY